MLMFAPSTTVEVPVKASLTAFPRRPTTVISSTPRFGSIGMLSPSRTRTSQSPSRHPARSLGVTDGLGIGDGAGVTDGLVVTRPNVTGLLTGTAANDRAGTSPQPARSAVTDPAVSTRRAAGLDAVVVERMISPIATDGFARREPLE
ncbi:hypothetical protein Misp03_40120 [Microbispora sp. NBRC 16548]|nr:hypothetical protein Misp03_40120 [Microbispora sp. NBRC 16548]